VRLNIQPWGFGGPLLGADIFPSWLDLAGGGHLRARHQLRLHGFSTAGLRRIKARLFWANRMSSASPIYRNGNTIDVIRRVKIHGDVCRCKSGYGVFTDCFISLPTFITTSKGGLPFGTCVAASDNT
jgi:hypothetical protein